MSDELLVVENLKKYFPVTRGLILQREVAAVQAVDDISFTVRSGEQVLIDLTVADLQQAWKGEEA